MRVAHADIKIKKKIFNVGSVAETVDQPLFIFYSKYVAWILHTDCQSKWLWVRDVIEDRKHTDTSNTHTGSFVW